MEWYSIRVISGKEVKAREDILFEAEEAKIVTDIEEIFVPTQKVVEVRQGKKRVKEKVFFPGYILIKMDLNAESRYVVENTNGVLNFIGSNNVPVPLRAKEVARIVGEVEKIEGKEVVECPFSIGDSVKVVDGPFDDFTGHVDDINSDKQKVKVMVSIFGRPTPVELDFFQVKLEK
ncbi:MAG: transcription termination/antitermination factor NusG [Pelagibacterales bacterium]|nr:transcription termination/antitermination factor NusG [Pelagibacterales bacterium]